MPTFKRVLMPLSEKFARFCRDIIQQLENKYIVYGMRFKRKIILILDRNYLKNIKFISLGINKGKIINKKCFALFF